MDTSIRTMNFTFIASPSVVTTVLLLHIWHFAISPFCPVPWAEPTQTHCNSNEQMQQSQWGCQPPSLCQLCCAVWDARWCQRHCIYVTAFSPIAAPSPCLPLRPVLSLGLLSLKSLSNGGEPHQSLFRTTRVEGLVWEQSHWRGKKFALTSGSGCISG